MRVFVLSLRIFGKEDPVDIVPSVVLPSLPFAQTPALSRTRRRPDIGIFQPRPKRPHLCSCLRSRPVFGPPDSMQDMLSGAQMLTPDFLTDKKNSAGRFFGERGKLLHVFSRSLRRPMATGRAEHAAAKSVLLMK
jgi:hypothetical protein